MRQIQGRTLYFVVVSIFAVVLLFFTYRYYTNTTAHEVYIKERLYQINKFGAAEVKKIYITAGYRNGELPFIYQIELDGKKDKEDIDRLFESIKAIHISRRKVRIPAGRDRIVIYWKSGGGLELWGCFDPARAPVISPGMRSDDFSQIVHEIAKRKGKKVIPGKYKPEQ
ncbi:MAG: hypothetical protein HYX78_09960 [Armatimonadetes bacterium]|nr:hypothetical protein [Armatimonadota bacterium]